MGVFFLLFLLIFVYSISTAVRLRQHNLILNSYDHNIDSHTILSGNDGYRWLRYADEMKRGVYLPDSADILSGSPDHAMTPPVRPLLSVMIWHLSDVTGKSYEESAGLLTVFLSGLFIFPLGVLLCLNGLSAAAVGGAVTGSLGFAYLSRTAGFQPDTDMFNLFFPMMIILCIYLTKNRLYLFSAVAGLFSYLFYQWYFHSGFSLVWLGLLAAYLMKLRTGKKQMMIAIVIFCVMSGVVQISQGLFGIYEFFGGYGHQTHGVFVSEMAVKSFTDSLRILTADGWSALFGMIVSLLYFKRLWLLSPLYILGVLMFFKGERYGMYLTIFAGIGIGCAIEYLLQKMRHGRALAMALTLFVCLMSVRSFLNFVPAPYVNREFFDAIYKLKPEKGSVVISHWDYGFLIEYLKGATCASDGATQFGRGSSFTTDLFNANGGEVDILRKITAGKAAYVIISGGDAAKLIHNSFFAEVKTTSVNKIMTQNRINTIKNKITNSEYSGDLLMIFDEKRRKLMVFNNKTLKSFFGKTYIIKSANVYCIHSIIRNEPAISVYKADATCLGSK